MHPQSYYQKYKGPRVHVQVWIDAHGPVPKGYFVDHKNGDIHDNRLCNLRLATPTQNMCNTRMPRNNKTGLKGLSWSTIRNMWRGSIVVNRKQFNVHGDLLKVAAWLHTKRIELHGEFARFK